MIKKYTTLIVVILIFGCQHLNKKNTIISYDFKIKLLNYIKNNPIIFNETHFLDLKFPHPSYNIYFYKTKLDTIVVIKLSSHMSSFMPYIKRQNENNIINSELKSIGCFFIDKNPIIVFDSKNYSKNIFNKKGLKQKIPDSLRFTTDKINRHLKSKTKYYKVTGDTLIDIELEVIK